LIKLLVTPISPFLLIFFICRFIFYMNVNEVTVGQFKQFVEQAYLLIWNM